LQVVVPRPEQSKQSCSNVLVSFLVDATNTESFGSRKAGPSFVNSKEFYMFSAAYASSIIDSSSATINEGVVDSPSNKEIG
jgi:hypothetical protein